MTTESPVRRLVILPAASDPLPDSIDREIESYRSDLHPPGLQVARCDTCRWWERLKDGGKPGGTCRRIHDSSGLTHGSKAVAVDDGGMFASLFTAPEFGCVQWQPKDATATKERIGVANTHNTGGPNLEAWHNLLDLAHSGDPVALEALVGLEALPEVQEELEDFVQPEEGD